MNKRSYSSAASGGGGAEETSLFHFCQERKALFCIQLDALMMLGALCGFAGLLLGAIALSSINSAGSQSVINSSGMLGPGVMSFYVTTNSPQIFNLPRELNGFVGKTYHVDCAFPGHQISILPGGASWLPSGSARTATCTAANCGLTYRVTAVDKIRVVSSVNFSFA